MALATRLRSTSHWSDPRVKPPFGSVEIDLEHPLRTGTKVLVLANEGGGIPHDLARGLRLGSPNGTPTWATNTGGLARDYTTDTQYDLIGTEGSNLTLPTNQITCLLIRRKKDTGLASAAGSFGLSSGGTSTFGAMLPYTNGQIFWDVGTARLEVAFTPVTTLETWVFVGGPLGMAIYREGVRLASSGTAVSRTVSTSQLRLNDNTGSGVSGGYLQETGFFSVLDAEWTADMAARWHAGTYAGLHPIIRRRYFFFTPAAGAAENIFIQERVGRGIGRGIFVGR